jgi:hypothetical protein
VLLDPAIPTPHRRGWEDLATIVLYSHVNWDDEEMKRKEAE